jgi:hypothetical protein
MARIRTVDFLPEIFQTSTNKQFLSATLDQLVQEPQFKKIQGFVGRRVGPGVNPNDEYVKEEDATRTNYQLEPGVISIDPDNSKKILDAITYPGITDAIDLAGGITTRQDRLYTSDYYAWDPFVDYDKLVNFSQYYWLPAGPDAVDVFAGTVPLTDNFVVTRANGSYSFSGVGGTNPELTLVRGGNYTFQVAQNDKETVNLRVSNRGITSWVIDYQDNPTLTLVRGNTYIFTLVQSPAIPFYIKTQQTLGVANLYNVGVSGNGASTGIIEFVVPQDAPDVLYYNSSTEVNMRGQFNIVDATPGTGPGFWIQTDPGVNGVLPASPNISSREVLGVQNNGEDLGTVTFNVPLANAQNFYYTLDTLAYNSGRIDLVADSVKFNQVNNIGVTQFLRQYPNGIDGITNLDGRTVIFTESLTDPQDGGWEITSFYDPLATGDNFNIGSFDTTLYDQTTPIVDVNDQRSLWQINYVTTAGGYTYMQLTRVSTIDRLEKFNILYGTKWSSTSWYKDASGAFEKIPLLTAVNPLLYYQDGTDPAIFGRIKIIEPDQASTLDIDEILGKKQYTSPNGVTLTNGLKVQFLGEVFPTSYANNQYYVEGVGTAIQLLPVTDFITPETYTQSATIPYDSTPYDVGNYDGSLNQPLVPDYLTINRSAYSKNAWSRSNRWFHIDVVNASALYNNSDPIIDNRARARRPILEYRGGLRLFNFGTDGKTPIDVIDFNATDALSTINGTSGYGVDGYNFINGSRVIFANDQDPAVRNKIYEVQLIVPDTVAPLIVEPIINLVPASDSTVLVDQNVVCLSGNTLQGVSFWFDGAEWHQAQQKSGVNQPPLFDLYDLDGVSFGNSIKYPSTNFAGNKLFSYAQGSGTADPVLGFVLRYLSLNNVGDIVFDNNLYVDSSVYTKDSVSTTLAVSTGVAREYADRTVFGKEIGWQPAVTKSQNRQQFKFSYDGRPLQLDVAVLQDNLVPAVQLYVGSVFQDPGTYNVNIGTDSTVIVLLNTFVTGDIIEVNVLSDQASKVAYYQVPLNLENNPLNVNSEYFTLGTARAHYETIGQNLLALQGPINGANNTRDLGNLVPYGTNIIQNSSPMTLAGYFMRSQQYNVFNAIDYNSREYEQYKAQLLDAVVRNDYTNYTIPNMLTAVITDLVAERTQLNPFYWSDMLPGSAVYTETQTVFTAISITTFPLNTTYDFTSSNYKSVLVYVNDVILTVNEDYTVATDAPSLTITAPLSPGDVIMIREYATTYGSFVPNTPTKLGLYPAYRPAIYLDTTYQQPTLVILGHDGSKTIAFDDFRDQLLLEFETRIYNNLKIKSDIPLPVTEVMPGQFRTTAYSLNEVNQILSPSFLSWIGWNKLVYQTQEFNPTNEFTYNYSAAGNILSSPSDIPSEVPLPVGAWRGLYMWFYDTVTPHTTPWQMLGFTFEPTWWQDIYGPAPYTSGNLVLWDDLAAGRVADPAGSYILPRYVRPNLADVIPVDSEGRLLAPFFSVMGMYDRSQFEKSWVFGDQGPVEYSWRASSAYPYALMKMLAVTRPAEFFSLFADRDLYKFDTDLDQYLYNGRYRLDANGIEIYGNGVSKASYIDWIIDYNQQLGRESSTELSTALVNLDVRLCYRMGAFTDKQYLKVYTEKSSPNSTNTSLLLPDDSFNLLLYKNQPFERVTYSSVIIQVVEDGYAVFGYSITQPYFNILVSRVAGTKKIISAGGTSVQVPDTYFQDVVKVPYGYVFTNETVVVDFLLSYGALLESQGLSFNNQENGRILNWTQMAQEFLYWANQGWATGAVINLNPSATALTATKAQAIVDSIVAQTPENSILDQNRLTLPVRDLVIDRQDNTFKVSSLSSQTISYLDVKYTNYETMLVLDNVSIFNDLIYNPGTGARQSRINIVAFVSADWNGQVDAQGFILNNNATVTEWRPYRKYAKGEIVLYKNNYWSAQTIVQPQAEFNYGNWVKSDYTKIQSGLLQNLPNFSNQLASSYDINTANLETDQDLLAWGLIGFRPREYMTALNLDDVSQLQVYKQFIKDKGTLQSVRLLGNANLGKERAEYTVFENWAIQKAIYGANANRRFVELRLNAADLLSDPSIVQIINPDQSSLADQTVLVENIWRESYPFTQPDIFPTTTVPVTDVALPSAGYVNLDDVDVTVFSLDGDLGLAPGVLDTIGIGTTVWAAKSNRFDWNVYRASGVPGRIVGVESNLNNSSLVQFSQPHGLVTDDVLVIRFVDPTVNGVYRVLAVPSLTTVVIPLAVPTQLIDLSGIAYTLDSMRVAQASDIITSPVALELLPGSKIWVDNNGSGLWQVLEKQDPFTFTTNFITDPPVTNSNFGCAVAQSSNNIWALIGANGYGTGAIYPYVRDLTGNLGENPLLSSNTTGMQGFGTTIDVGNQQYAITGAPASNSNQGYAVAIWRNPSTGVFEQTQMFVAPDLDFANGEFGSAVTISEDERWLYIGAPGKNKVYVYGQFEQQDQFVEYRTDGTTRLYSFAGRIVINDPEQIGVVLNNKLLTLGVEYTINGTVVDFVTTPTAGLLLNIYRKESVNFIGDGSTRVYPVSQYLYCAVNIYSASVYVNGVLQRPEIDYDFNSDSATDYLDVVFATAPANGSLIVVNAKTYWQYTDTITVPGLAGTARFGQSLACTGDGRQVIVGAINDNAGINYPRAGATYVFDRGVTRYLISDPSVMTFPLPGGYNEPVAVKLNGQFLMDAMQFTDGQYEIVGGDVELNSLVTLNVGDILEIENNIFTQIQKINSAQPFDEADYGAAVDICPTSCSVYIGAPNDGSILLGAGAVDRVVNQARLYGTITSPVQNPSLTAGQPLRINNYVINVPSAPNNTVTGLAAAINNSIIPNVTATVTNGYLTLTVSNFEASTPFSRLQVLPGYTGTAFTNLGFNTNTYVYVQTVTSPRPSASAHFGESLNISSDALTLVVGAPQGDLFEPTTFDQGRTYFDDRSTRYFYPVIESGSVYTYDYLPSATTSVSNPGKFVFGQQIYNNFIYPQDRWGTAVDYTGGLLLVGAPDHRINGITGPYGMVGNFSNWDRLPAWQVLRQQVPVVDVQLINNAFMYDKMSSAETYFFDFIDPLQGKILGAARQNIDYIGAIDPAKYNQGPINNNGNYWGKDRVGEIWWDTNSVRFIDPNQDDIVYASRRWSQVFPGSRVDIYQWVESPVPPSAYQGPGTVLSTTSFTVKATLTNQGTFQTYYYFWVTGVDVINTNAGKTLSTTGISRYIESPRSSGIPYVAILNASTVAIYNGLQYLSASDTILHIEFDQVLTDANVHTEFELIAVNDPNSFINDQLYRKLQDSFCGENSTGAKVPDALLSPGERYGVQFRPRQSMFIDRFKALENYLTRVNAILAQYPIVESRTFTLLNSSEPEPTVASGEWDKRLLNMQELSYQNINAVPIGYKYLIVSDDTNNGLWTIYEVITESILPSSPRRLQLYRVQTYDTRKYWQYIDWYQPGYNRQTIPVATVQIYSNLSTLPLSSVPVGSSVKVTANAQNKFEIYVRMGENSWDRVALQDGTIEFKAELWNYQLGRFGFDVEVFDAQYFDQEPVTETRKIIQAINQELLIDDLAVERNRCLILIFDYILTEFENPEWLTKTSLIDVVHRIRELVPYQIYRQDNQEFVLDYLQEVKPYHVQVKEFNLAYDGMDDYQGTLTDFDNPAYFNQFLEVPQYISPVLTPYDPTEAKGTGQQSTIADTAPNAEIWAQFPWSDWYNNYLLTLEAVSIVNSGQGYTVAPQVIIGEEWQPNTIYALGQQIFWDDNLYTVTVAGTTGTAPPDWTFGAKQSGTATLTYAGTTAQGVVSINSAGRLTNITVTEPGSGYLVTPVVIFVGGNGAGARAYAVMGNSLVRDIKTTIKYDRYEYTSQVVDWQANVSYDNGTLVRYADQVWSANSGDSGPVDSATFNFEEWLEVPASTLSGVDRTQGFYLPAPTEPGLQLPLLIDGIDYPGVQVQGPLFNQDTGFDVGNYDINPYDNISYDAAGQPTFDPAILDVIYYSEYLDPFLGTRPGDVNVDGGAYVDTYSSHAPEELVPGAEFDTLDFRVYTTPGADWTLSGGHGFQVASRRFTFDPENPELSFDGLMEYPFVAILWNISFGVAVIPLYYDWVNFKMNATGAALPGNTMLVSVFGVGGGNQLWKESFLGSDVINRIVVPFPYDSIYQFCIYNGEIPLFPNLNYTWEPIYEDTGPTTTVDPTLSTGTTLVVGSTEGIFVGSLIDGDGFTLGQYVQGIVNTTTLVISAAPDGVLLGDLTFYRNTNTTAVNFSATYTGADRINICALGYANQGVTHSFSIPQFQNYVMSGPLTIPLYNSIQGTNPANLMVFRQGRRARGYEGAEYIGDGTTTTFELPWSGDYSQGLVADNDVLVYLSQYYQQVLGVDYFVDAYDGSSLRTITFVNPPEVGQFVLISVRTMSQYWVNEGDPSITFRPSMGLSPQIGDIISITTYNDTSEQGLLVKIFVGPNEEGVTITEGYEDTLFDQGNTSFAPGSYNYSFGTTVLNNKFDTGRVIGDPERLLITVDGILAPYGLGYTVEGLSTVVIAGPPIGATTVVQINFLTATTVPDAMAFRIFQDMRGLQLLYRITSDTTTYLVQPVAFNDDEIFVHDASTLAEPDLSTNIWPALTINGERILYRERDLSTNSVRSLLRGTAGTAIAEHETDDLVYNLSIGNLAPLEYQDYLVSDTLVGDATTTQFTAVNVNIAFEDSTIRDETVRVFVGGTLQVGNYTITQDNPVIVEFDEPPPSGVEVTIAVRRGVDWYNPGPGTPSDGVPLQRTDNLIARFLRGQV